MQINVTVNKVEITDENIINKGEYNIHTCEFTFSEEYNGLIKRAIFANILNEIYMVDIVDNTCVIPEEILKLRGNIVLGVYAYEVNEKNKLVKRYSPEPAYFYIENGSYSEKAMLPEESVKDLIQRVEDLIAEVEEKMERGDFDGVGISNIVFNPDYTMTITLTDGRVIISPSLRGQDGYTPQKGTDYYTEQEKQEIQEEIEGNIDETLNSLQEQITENKMELTENEITELINSSF